MLGVELFVCKQPTLIVENLSAEEMQRCRYENHGFDHDAHVDAFKQIYEIIDQEVRTDRVIDLTPLSGRPELFHDHIHPTSEGAARVAEIVASVLSARLSYVP